VRGTFYTAEEDDMLIRLRESNLTNREISDEMPGRSFHSVIGRLHRLRCARRVL